MLDGREATVWADQAREATREAMRHAREAVVWTDHDLFFQTAVGPMRRGGSDYATGLSFLQRRDYEQAIVRFDRAVTRSAGLIWNVTLPRKSLRPKSAPVVSGVVGVRSQASR